MVLTEEFQVCAPNLSVFFPLFNGFLALILGGRGGVVGAEDGVVVAFLGCVSCEEFVNPLHE